LVQGAEKGGILGATVGTIGGLLAGVRRLTVGVVGGTAVGLGLMVKGIWDTPGVVAAIATDNDLHGKETIDLSQVEAIQMGTRDWDARSQTKVLDKETEYTRATLYPDTRSPATTSATTIPRIAFARNL
jgi:hypothetical protein